MYNLVIVRGLRNDPNLQVWDVAALGEYAKRKTNALKDALIMDRPLTPEETELYLAGKPLGEIFAAHLEAARITCRSMPTV